MLKRYTKKAPTLKHGVSDSVGIGICQEFSCYLLKRISPKGCAQFQWRLPSYPIPKINRKCSPCAHPNILMLTQVPVILSLCSRLSASTFQG